MSLQEYLKDSQMIELAIIENGGEISLEMEEFLTKVNLDIAESVDRTHMTLDRFDNAVTYWKSKASEYSRIASSLENAHKRLKDRIKSVMRDAGKTDLIGVEYRYKLSKLKPVVKLIEEDVPKEYFKEKITLVPDKERIRQDLELGVPVAGAILEESFALRPYPNKGDK